jgi:hypothetical protein
MKNESINENTVEENPELSFPQIDGKCYCCGKSGHKSPNCQWKSEPKQGWAINKLRNQQHQQSNINNSRSNGQQSYLSTNGTNQNQLNTSSASSSVMSAWSGANVQFYQSMNIKTLFYLEINQQSVYFAIETLWRRYGKSRSVGIVNKWW